MILRPALCLLMMMRRGSQLSLVPRIYGHHMPSLARQCGRDVRLAGQTIPVKILEILFRGFSRKQNGHLGLEHFSLLLQAALPSAARCSSCRHRPSLASPSYLHVPSTSWHANHPTISPQFPGSGFIPDHEPLQEQNTIQFHHGLSDHYSISS